MEVGAQMGMAKKKVEINPHTFKFLMENLTLMEMAFTINYLPTPSLLGKRTRKN